MVETGRASPTTIDRILNQEDEEENENDEDIISSASDSEDQQQHNHRHNIHNPTMALLAEEKMRRKLQFFFMNPIEKWHAKRRFPYKFGVQLIKIILVTMQLCLFAYSRYNHVNYTWDNRVSFSHLFLMNWDAAMEVNSYPPATGPLALYKKEEFFDAIDYAFHGYSNLSDAIGPYSYDAEDNSMSDMKLCLYHYKKGNIYGFNESYEFNSEIEETCVNITLRKNAKEKFSSKRYLGSFEVNFSALVKARLMFAVKTVNFKAAGPITPPDCYKFQIVIKFDNQDHDGQMLLELDAEPIRLLCKGDTEYIIDNQIDSMLRSLLNYLVIIICAVSLVLCSRALIRAQQLKYITVQFFKEYLNKELSQEGRMEFLNLWYIMIIVNDFLIIIGSIIKEQIERKEFTSDQWNICSVFLGTGNMLVWFGVLRYLGFFKTYNVVILTLKRATPKISRFLLCALLIYAGFTFCGWLILGPYHMKFRSLATTSECLYSLINGDDMFATFSIMSHKSPMLWWYSRVYLYTFISLFIYVVLSLFISVIIDAYDTIKLYYKDGFPKNDLLQFIGDATIEDFSSGIFRTDSNPDISDILKDLCCCRKFRRTYSSLCDAKHNGASSSAICV